MRNTGLTYEQFTAKCLTRHLRGWLQSELFVAKHSRLQAMKGGIHRPDWILGAKAALQRCRELRAAIEARGARCSS
jgi:hypothetical protein